MPDSYKNIDIEQWCLSKCITDTEVKRVELELTEFKSRNLFPVLQCMIYIVDTLRSNNIVWGVGRGSSVSSYVLFLIGVHKIDSIKYGLDIKEFLR
jgi:DNA polymerase III alpha subunit